MTKLLLMNIPASSIKIDYPPIGISRVMEGIDPSLNCGISFLDLDHYRPSFDDIKCRIQDFQPDLIGFSAILTPTYAYLKKLSNFIKENFPAIIQVMGGEMAAISNIVLLRTGIDFCCTGESEPTFSNLIRKLQQDNFQPAGLDDYININGLVFLLNDIPYFTGYEEPNLEKSLRQFNYKLLSEFTNLNHYFHRVDEQYFKDRVNKDKLGEILNLLYPHNQNKNVATVFASKGCVGKCTFCHRFFKGYKVADVDEVIKYIENVKKDLNVGTILFSEENFGSNRKSTIRLVEYLQNSGLNWAATAVRVTTVNEETIKAWRQAGCMHINFGIESCSQKMLDVMEKRATVKHNLDAIKLCHKYKIHTSIGSVMGMPGETEQTIQETIDNLSSVVPDDVTAPFILYRNFVQVVPGTAIYEYAKQIGLIGQSFDDEEKYIEDLCEVNAEQIKHYLNFTDYQKEEVAYWGYYICLEVVAAYIKKHGYWNVFKNQKSKKFKAGLMYVLLPKKIRKIFLKYFAIIRFFGLSRVGQVVYKKIFKKSPKKFEHISTSVRKLVEERPVTLRADETKTAAFRMRS